MNSVYGFMLLCLFLGIGFAIREMIPIFRKLFIPASVIGGFVYLIAGPQVLKLVPMADFISGMTTPLLVVILTCTVFGSKMNRERIHSYLDFTCVNVALYGFQLFAGVAIGAALSKIWTGLPPNWGVCIPYGFYGGHGNAAASAVAFTEAGYTDYMGIALICATLGLIIAILFGMVITNWGIRKGFLYIYR